MKGGRTDAALQIFERMPRDGVQRNAITYGTVISACMRGGRTDDALRIFEQMPKDGIQRNVIVYNAAISACEKGGRIDDALRIFEQMPQDGLRRDAITYSIVISACAKRGQLDDVLRLFAQMRTEGIERDTIAYSVVISACESRGRTDEIQRLLSQSVEDGVCRAELGYDRQANTLDFHVNAVQGPCEGPHPPAVSASIARAIFDYHHRKGNLNLRTGFIVGQHGCNVIKDAISQSMRRLGWIPEHGVTPAGFPNPGLLRIQALGLNQKEHP